MSQKRPYSPRPVAVETGDGGRPATAKGLAVTQIKEEWLVEDGWWTGAPLRRHYFELVLCDGRNLVVYRDEGDAPAGGGHWYMQRA